MAERTRTMWKGFLRLSLVTIPVRMVTATQSANEIRFHQIDRTSNQRIRYQKVVPGKGEVDKDDIVRGYEVEPGKYVLLEDEELDAVKIESAHTIELTQFVEACEIDPLYFEKPYYLLPDGDVAEEGYRVIRDALRTMGRVGIGQQAVRGRENLVTVHPAGNGLLLEVLRYEEEIKEADDIFAGIGSKQLRGDLIEMAQELIERRTQPFDPDRYENHYAQALRDLVQRKIETGRSVSVEEEEESGPGTVVDFMEALRRSVAKETGDTPKSTAPSRARSEAASEKPARKASAKPEAPKPARAAAKAASETRKSAPASSAKTKPAAKPEGTGKTSSRPSGKAKPDEGRRRKAS